MRQCQNKKLTKKNSKKNKNMGGGSGQPIHSDNVELNLLFEQILKSLVDNGYYAHSNILDEKNVFEIDHNGRHKLKLREKFFPFINKQNNRGQTPLYCVLRFNPVEEMIKMLLDVPDIDVNARNSTDNSTPLIGACFGKDANTPIYWEVITLIIKTLCLRGADITLTNIHGETPLTILQKKFADKLVIF